MLAEKGAIMLANEPDETFLLTSQLTDDLLDDDSHRVLAANLNQAPAARESFRDAVEIHLLLGKVLGKERSRLR